MGSTLGAVYNLLGHAVVPPFYVARFDALEPTYGAVNAQQLKQTLSQGSIKSSQVDEASSLTHEGAVSITRADVVQICPLPLLFK